MGTRFVLPAKSIATLTAGCLLIVFSSAPALSEVRTDELEARLASAEGDLDDLRARSIAIISLMGVALISITALCNHKRRRIKQLQLEAERASRVKSNFLADISHEIRAPLHVIQGNADLLAEEISLDSESRRGLRAIQRSGRHLSDLLSGVLDMSKIETGQFEVAEDPFSVLEVLDEVKTIFLPQANSQGVQLTIHWGCETDLSWARGDSGKLRQILVNLTQNALRRTTSGSVELHATVEDNQLVARILDTGFGFDPEELEQIFVRFQRGEKTGSGLGLAISRELATRLGGSLTAQLRDSGGSEFILRLPHSLCSEIPEPEGQHPLRLEGEAPVRILIVDDHTEQQEVSTRIVEHMGAEVICASNAAGARSMIAQEVPHVALIDLEMPREDGYTLLRVLSKTTPRPLLIAVSVSAFQSDREAALEAGATAFVPKPIDKGQLAKVLREHLPLKSSTGSKNPTSGRTGAHK